MYIGKQPVVGNFQVCDAITVVNGQAAYTMQVSSANVEPENANHMLVSLNGILQKPGSSFTISGATITFASNLATGDSIDFIILLGNVLDIGTPSDSTITSAKLASTFLTGETDIGGALADADLFLVDDGAGGTLRKTAASRLKTYIGGTAPYVSVYRSSDQTISSDTWTKIQFNTEVVDSAGAFDNSTNYRFTPQTSGYYFVSLNCGSGWTGDGTIANAKAGIYKNGSIVTGSTATRDHDPGNDLNYNDIVNTSFVVQCNGSSDYIEGYGYLSVTSGTPRFEANQVSMHIFKIG